MTTDQAEPVDVVRAFTTALGTARHKFEMTQQTPGEIYAALERGYTPETLAKYLGNNVRHYLPGDANQLMHWRLKRAAGHDQDDQEEGARMALPWVRLDTGWFQNPKFLQLVEDKAWRPITVYMGALGWSGAQGQDGYIPAYALPMIHGTKKEAAQLVEVELWRPAQGGWDINDWSDYQLSSEEHQRRSERARAAAQKRWANT